MKRKNKKGNMMKRLFLTITAIFILIYETVLAGDYNTPFAKDYNVHFSGSTGNYANFSREPNIGYANTTLTIEAWINTSNTAYTFQEIFCNILDGNYNTNYKNLQLRTDINGYLEFGMNTGAWQSVKSTQQVATGKWVHVSVVKNGTGTNNVTLYINGVANATGTVSQDFTPDQMLIGAYFQNGSILSNTYFNGNIDEIRIWNVARTQTAIEDDMYKELAGTETGLISYYKMNEGSGTTLADASSNDYILDLYGSDWQWQIFSSGAGTEASPYLIATLRDLQILSHNVSVWSNYFKQTANIDASATLNWDYGVYNTNDSKGFMTIGRYYNTVDDVSFNGSYDGQNYTISNIYIERSNSYYTGLFGMTNGAIIKNLGIVNCNIIGMNTVGGLAGKTSLNTHISNVYVTGNVQTTNYNIGGLIGFNGVSTSDNNCTVYNSYTNANVTGATNCGGLIGSNYGKVKNVYALGTVAGNYSGGLISTNSGSVVDSYVSGSVSGNLVGGLVYSNTGNVSYCYSVAEILIGSTNAGGFMYSSGTSLTANYWRQDAGSFNSGLNDLFSGNVINISSATNANMQLQITYNGWNFVREWDIESGTNNGYPFLLPLPSGPTFNGSSYLISTMNDLYWLSQRTDVWDANFLLTANIDASETSNYTVEGFEPIGNNFSILSCDFTGSFNGQNFTISNLYINLPTKDYIGLFGLASGATLENIEIVNCDITGYNYVGALSGRNGSNCTISNVSSTGAIEGTGNYIGGIVGINSSSNINNSFSTATVVGKIYVGGLIGGNSQSSISESYATGSLSGTSYMGGLIGNNSTNGNINKTYATGNIVATGTNAGGLIGYNTTNCNIDLSYSSGSVTASGYAGGFIAYNHASNSSGACNITNCYSKGNAYSGNTYVGGFIGYNSYGAISYSYSAGEVTGNINYKGGFIGNNVSGTFNSNFWRQDIGIFNDGLSDIKTAGNVANITATTTAAMKINSTYLNADWNTTYWNIDAGFNDGYPHLDWQNPSGVPLPVEFISFTASYNDDKVVLNWQTATEVNNYGFNIELRVENGEWRTIGFVSGHGNSNSPKSYSFVDNLASTLALAHNLNLDRLQYRLKQIDFDGKYEYSDVVEVRVEIPTQFKLEQNYPNPFNPSTVIKYSIPRSIRRGEHSVSQTTLKVYDILGKEIATLVDENQKTGNYEVTFDASNLSTGVYFYRLTSGSFTKSMKMLLIK
jgi:hypothetical protein